jgi:hypothetical protein
MTKLKIGKRWKPGPVERRDTGIGFYEEINPVRLGKDAASLQDALLSHYTPRSKPTVFRVMSRYSYVAMLAAAAAFVIVRLS